MGHPLALRAPPLPHGEKRTRPTARTGPCNNAVERAWDGSPGPSRPLLQAHHATTPVQHTTSCSGELPAPQAWNGSPGPSGPLLHAHHATEPVQHTTRCSGSVHTGRPYVAHECMLCRNGLGCGDDGVIRIGGTDQLQADRQAVNQAARNRQRR